jgi:UDP-N-acetylglucosamine 2-epimerase (non-hydrolysing)
MSDVFFRDLGLPSPDLVLRSGGGSHAEQTAAVLVGVEADLKQHRPRVLVVVGDVNGTLAAALAAAKQAVPVAHVEAGLRSHDWTMPEEINRTLTDRLADLLLVPSRDAAANLLAEGLAPERVIFVGNVLIDSLHHAPRSTDALARLGLTPGAYALGTAHRPANVDSPAALAAALDALAAAARRIPVVFTVHPRTLARLEEFGLMSRLLEAPGLRPVKPVGYIDFIALLRGSKFVVTDAGGVQEEATALGVPCLTLRAGTERPVTVTEGTNTVVGLDGDRIDQEVSAILAGRGKRGRVPEGWDGRAGERIADALLRFLDGTPPPKTHGPRA